MEWYLDSPALLPDLRLRWDGGTELLVDDEGNLVLRHAFGELIDPAPKAWQIVDGETVFVDCAYALGNDNEFGFVITGDYELNVPLVIDPLLPYSTYLGGTEYSFGSGVVANAAGEAYVAGGTLSSDFPTTPGAFQTTLPGNGAAFISKFSADGSSLIFSTLLSGSVHEEATSIQIDPDGNVYVGGLSFSFDFPVTPGAYQTTLAGNLCCFMSKLSPDGSSLIYSTYLGGSDGDNSLTHIALDDQGCVYATGITAAANFPVTPGAFATVYPSGGIGASFAAKLSQDGSALVYSSFLGGSNTDYGECIALDSQYCAYLTGYTYSTDFPTTSGAYQAVMPGPVSAYVTKFAPDGSALEYSTYLGGSLMTNGMGIAVDALNQAHITGDTYATDFPTTPNAFQPVFGGLNINGFISILNTAGDALIASTFIGTDGTNKPKAIALSDANRVYITGHTSSENFPITPDIIPSSFSGIDDCFISILSPDLSALAVSFYIGGSATEIPYSIALGSSGDMYITGNTNSSDYPVTTGAFQTTFSGVYDAILTRMIIQFLDLRRATLSFVKIA